MCVCVCVYAGAQRGLLHTLIAGASLSLFLSLSVSFTHTHTHTHWCADEFAAYSEWKGARAGSIAWLASNCHTTSNRRTAFVAELMRHIRVDRYV
jgi:hypothetical protein